MERESFKLVKEYSEASIAEKRRALSDKFLLRGTSYVFINAGRCFFFESQNQESGVLKNFQAAEGLKFQKLHFRWEFTLISVCG